MIPGRRMSWTSGQDLEKDLLGYTVPHRTFAEKIKHVRYSDAVRIAKHASRSLALAETDFIRCFKMVVMAILNHANRQMLENSSSRSKSYSFKINHYVSIGTPLDRFFKTDLLVELQVLEGNFTGIFHVGIDITLNTDKPDPPTEKVVVFFPEDVRDIYYASDLLQRNTPQSLSEFTQFVRNKRVYVVAKSLIAQGSNVTKLGDHYAEMLRPFAIPNQ